MIFLFFNSNVESIVPKSHFATAELHKKNDKQDNQDKQEKKTLLHNMRVTSLRYNVISGKLKLDCSIGLNISSVKHIDYFKTILNVSVLNKIR